MKTKTGLLALTVAVLFSVLLFGCAQAPEGGTQATGGNRVTITADAFSPPELTIKVGDTVTWVNEDEKQRDVTFAADQSPVLDKGESWSKTFTRAGVYNYEDSIQPVAIKGVVTVE